MADALIRAAAPHRHEAGVTLSFFAMLSLRHLIAACAILGAGFLSGAELPSIQTAPKHVGSREIILEFSSDSPGKASDIKITSSEASGLNNWAAALTRAGVVKLGGPGVKSIGENRYRASINFPVEQDGEPIAADCAGPALKFHKPPKYPFELRRKGVAGGALLALTIDKNANLKRSPC